jgi:hypothetical protein
MNQVVPLLVALLAAGCLAAEPSAADDAQEALVHHFTDRVGEGPWEVICLSREAGAGQEDEATFLQRFESHPLPVVGSRLCAEAGEGSFAWIVEETSRIGIQLVLRQVRRNLDGSFFVPARTSTGTIDFTEYECTAVQVDGAWEVEECVVTITT